jgi:exo-beta-1,3-glucanase (GH17 family)
VTEIVTASAPDVIVYVNEQGEPISTSYVNAAPSTVAVTVASSAPIANNIVQVAAADVTSVAAPVASVFAPISSIVASIVAPSSAPSSSAPAASPSSSPASSGLGITYSPYNADGTCKSASQVSTDFANLDNYGLVRIYGTDCNQLNTVGSLAMSKGMKLFAGVYDISQTASEIAEIIAFANGNWANFHTISIGNELVNSGQASVSEVVGALGVARGLLQAAGYTGKLVTVDTWTAHIANPALCAASDYCAANAHAFFDATATAATAGQKVASYAQQVSAACGGKDTMITESGWPSAGNSNGAAVPSPQNQATAVASIKSAFDSNNLILFNAYNDMWKQNNAWTYGAENYWGIYGTSSA